MFSTESIEKYREIYRKRFGVDISPEVAAEQAQRLLNLARIVTQPMPKSWLEKYKTLLKQNEKSE